MARSGPAISAGPAIASSRGGAPMGVRVGGIEGGRSITVSPAEARITNIFGPAIKSHNIGFGIPNPRGERSVKSLDALRSFPVRGEDKARPRIATETRSNIIQFPVNRQVRPIEPVQTNPKIFRFPDGRQTRPVEIKPATPQREIILLPVTRTERVSVLTNVVQPERTSMTNPLVPPAEYQRLASRIRAFPSRLLAASGTRTTLLETPLGSVVTNQRLSRVGSRTTAQTHTLSAPKTENITRRLTQSVGAKNEKHSLLVREQEQERRKKRFIKIDDQTYADRLASLKRTLQKLKAINLTGNVDGRSFSQASEIFTNRFKSNILRQLGLEKDREDGSVYRLMQDLANKEEITIGDLETANENNAPVEIARRPVGRLASNQEVQKVWNPPQRPPEDLPTVLIREQVEVVKSAQEATILEPDSVVVREIGVHEAEEPKPVVAEDLKAQKPPLGVARLLDIGSNYNNIVGLESSILEREALMAA